jgi:hypothetical protein
MISDVVTIVSGLPRSGTSMMMKMLEAGGLAPVTDNFRTADEDNPKGYYELEKVKELKNDKSWMPEAKGKVVKVISALLQELPTDHEYRVVFMRRNMQEILDSQRQMLVRRGQPESPVPDEKMAAMFEKHLAKIEEWIAAQPNMRALYVRYNDALASPADAARRINEFLGGSLDEAAMVAVVDKQLYRQRRA